MAILDTLFGITLYKERFWMGELKAGEGEEDQEQCGPQTSPSGLALTMSRQQDQPKIGDSGETLYPTLSHRTEH